MSSAVASTSANRLSEDAISATHNVHCALSPRIGVLSSPDVQALLDANHLATFADLLRHFEDSIEHRKHSMTYEVFCLIAQVSSLQSL
jgi:hypothetical protein